MILTHHEDHEDHEGRAIPYYFVSFVTFVV
jgi:hypothetical protein